jgi:hypothetical protein
MRFNLFKCIAQFALAAACLGAAIGDGAAGSFTRACATRDMQILMLIETREVAESVSLQKLSDAMFAMTHARMVCQEGRVADALAIYETIAQTLISDSKVSSRIK